MELDVEIGERRGQQLNKKINPRWQDDILYQWPFVPYHLIWSLVDSIVTVALN